jgi:hypothetical protein
MEIEVYVPLRSFVFLACWVNGMGDMKIWRYVFKMQDLRT